MCIARSIKITNSGFMMLENPLNRIFPVSSYHMFFCIGLCDLWLDIETLHGSFQWHENSKKAVNGEKMFLLFSGQCDLYPYE